MTAIVWKASTLVLAGALTLVVSSGAAVQPIQACDNEGVVDRVNVSRQRLRAAFGLLDRTRDQLADADPSIHRTRALDHVQLAITDVQKALAPPKAPPPRPPVQGRVPRSSDL
ncbi:MAG: hypothetical protein WKG00_13605 [Polyangiaceae bacterium]